MRDIAVVGMACRFPAGLDDLDALLAALRQRTVTAGPVPADRWDAARYYCADENSKGKAYVDRGNFLKQDIRAMDAGFFDLPPRVAENLDPMQRLLLELIWEAFENAGLDLTAHAGKKVGVYVGGFMLDHMVTLMQPANRARHNANTAAGMMMTMLSNRLSHAFDLRGPSLSIDTACSSSLVAFSYACRDIWNGDCEMAVVGGANVMTRPEYPIGMCKGQFLSRDGQCKSFDERGDGYGRGEGGGIVVLKTLERALADGDTILATVAGAGVNSDGRTPGISMPSAEAQGTLIREVCERFSIDVSKVRYVECHGTGTAVGDPIEAESIGSVYGVGREGDARVVLGSIKSNIGHLEAGAGIAGIIKAVLTLMHREAFPLGNLQTPHPGIEFERLGVRLADAPIKLANNEESFFVAVNSFGYGGTNAHVVLRSAGGETDSLHASRQAEASARPADFPLMLPLSARHPEALKALAHRYSERLEHPEADLEDVLHSAALRRAHLSHRAVLLGADRAALIHALDTFAKGDKNECVVTGHQAPQAQRLPVWVFTGMGPQWWAMGQQLYREDAEYRAAVDHADDIFKGIAGFSILAEMLKEQIDSKITRTLYAQPANFMVQWGIAAMLRAAGVTPGAIVGHSVGEVTAAAVSGALSLEDALRVAYERSRLQATTAGTGSMLAVGAAPQALEDALKAFGGRIEIAAVNGPNTITLAGDTVAIGQLAEQLSTREIFNRVLNVEVPYHSYLMDPILGDLTYGLRSIVAREPSVPVISTVTGLPFEGPAFGADYWAQNVRRPVSFMQAVQTLLEQGFATFVEVGPHPVLSSAMRDCAKARANEIRLVETLRRNETNHEPERARVHRAIAQIFASGASIDWNRLNGAGSFTALPNYPWQREKSWLETERSAYQRISPTDRPLLGNECYPAHGVWVNDLEHENLAWLKDHVVSGTPVMPAAGYIETLLEAAATLHPAAPGWTVTDVAIHAPLVIGNDRAIDYVCTFGSSARSVELRSLESGKTGEGTLHLTGTVAPLKAASVSRLDLDSLKASLDQPVNSETFYRDLDRIGLQYGPAFRSIRSLNKSAAGDCVLAYIECPAHLPQQGYRAHPSMLDACFQALVGLLDDRESTWLPTGFSELRMLAPSLPLSFWCEAARVNVTPRHVDADIRIADDSGRVLAVIRGMRLTVSSTKLERRDAWGDPVKLQMVRYEWTERARTLEPTRLGRWLIVDDDESRETADMVAAGLDSYGASMCARMDVARYREPSGGRNVRPRLSREDAEAQIAATIAEAGPFDGVVFLHGLSARRDSDDPTATFALLLMQTVTKHLAAAAAPKRPRAYVVTRAAFDTTYQGAQVEPAQTAINSFARVAYNEIEGMRFSSIDLPAMASADDIDAAIQEIAGDAPEDEVAFRRGQRLFSRLTVNPWLTEPLVEDVAADGSRALLVRALGDREAGAGSVKLIEVGRAPLGDDEIELQIEALALTSRTLRASADDTFDDEFVEVVATVSGAGANVTDLIEGQRVYGFAPGDFASHIRGPRTAFHLTQLTGYLAPDSLLVSASREAVATRVVEQADLAVGSTALVLADPLGLVVAAALRAQGVDVTLVAASAMPLQAGTIAATSDAIETVVAERTRGQGFDAVVAPLQDWAESFGWRALAAGGVLIDTAARARPVAMPSASSAIVRADLAMLTKRPERFASALQHAVARAGRGDLAKAESLSISVADLAARKLAMPASDLTLIVRFDDQKSLLPVHMLETISVDPDAAYLVTGGLAGFGQKTASWLADHGARHLVLASRTGADTAERREFVASLHERGIQVLCVPCDVSDAGQVRAMFDLIAQLRQPLKGVFHAAAVIIDQTIVELDQNDFETVMRTKAEGARLLHEHTREMPLDYFVLYSSVANLVGNSRQVSYASANGYLDGLAWHRHSLGLPATSINWGAIADVGVIKRDEKLEQFMRYMGLRGMESAEALNWLERAICRGVPQLGVTLMTSWADWGRYEVLAPTSARYAELIAADASSDAGARDLLRAELDPLPATERFSVLTGLVASLIADELEMAPDSVPIDRSIIDLGVDSLMATDVQMVLDKNLGISIPVLEILNDLTVRAIVNKTLASFGWDDASGVDAVEMQGEKTA